MLTAIIPPSFVVRTGNFIEAVTFIESGS